MSKEMIYEGFVTAGGGTGQPRLLEAVFSTGKVAEVVSVTSGTDSGGYSGISRDRSRGQEIAVADSMKTAFALVGNKDSSQYKATYALFHARNKHNQFVLGQQAINQLYFDKDTGFAKLKEYFKDVGLDMRGDVLPSSTQPSNIHFVTESGQTYEGEHELDDKATWSDPIQDMWLEPEVDAFGPAVDAVKNAKLVLLSLGSFYGSVLSNGLPRGMKDAFKALKGKMYLVTNLLSTNLETNEFTPEQFAEKVEKYMGRRPDGLIVPRMTRAEFEAKYPAVALKYRRSHSHFLGWDDYTLTKANSRGLHIVKHDATEIIDGKNEKDKVVRHNTIKLGESMLPIFPNS